MYDLKDFLLGFATILTGNFILNAIYWYSHIPPSLLTVHIVGSICIFFYSWIQKCYLTESLSAFSLILNIFVAVRCIHEYCINKSRHSMYIEVPSHEDRDLPDCRIVSIHPSLMKIGSPSFKAKSRSFAR